MTIEMPPSTVDTQPLASDSQSLDRRRPIRSTTLMTVLLLVVFTAGLGSGYLMGRQSMKMNPARDASHPGSDSDLMIRQVNPPEGYNIPASYGNIGPKMLAAGAIDLDRFIQIYKQAGRPLTEEQMTILTKGSGNKIVINQNNAYFLLNFFWALGLVNENPILTEGPMIARGKDQIGNYASTGGWTLGAKPPTDLFASAAIVSLTEAQKSRLDEVASSVYRPCCDNPTHFPDCNHGMAMLGLLELMASQDATTAEMFSTAKYVNAFWYPQQMLEVATLFKATRNVDFAHADARQVVSNQYSSGTGFQAVHQWLAANGLLEQAPGSGGSCGVQ